MPDRLTHLDDAGRATMVDVTDKPATARRAVAEAFVVMRPKTGELIRGGGVAKGEVLAVARVAGVMAAKRTGELIPLCHPLPVEAVEVTFTWPEPGRLRIEAAAALVGKTGVEMEALVAASVAALTVYDMTKAVDRGMRVDGLRLIEKTGGQSGDWHAP